MVSTEVEHNDMKSYLRCSAAEEALVKLYLNYEQRCSGDLFDPVIE
jgi:hypothetical protein